MNRKSKKYRVWLVDDREENRKKFKENHGRDLNLDIFRCPDEVMKALEDGDKPDALLCDVYFYSDETRREKFEDLVNEKARELKDLAQQFNAEDAQLGIRLIRDVRDFFGGTPKFPIYAYTSKGPYLMQDEGFKQLEELNAEWLFKNKGHPYTEKRRIARDIEAYRKRFSWRSRLWEVAVVTGLISAIIGAVLGVIFARLAHNWWGW